MTSDPTGAALLRTVCLDPDSVDARLVYADWLEQEAGDAERAEFIRVQCRIAAINAEVQSDEDCGRELCVACQERRPLCRRERELLVENHLEWLGSLAALPIAEPPAAGCYWDQWRRGFVEAVACTAEQWEQHGPALVLAQPVLSVRLVGREPVHVEREAGFNQWAWSTPLAVLSPRPEYRRASLPQSIYDLCNGWYATEQDALDALSRACVAWARRQAGLDVPCPTCRGRLKLIADPRCRTCEGLGRVDDPGGEEGYLNDCIDCPDCNPVTCPKCKGAGWVAAR